MEQNKINRINELAKKAKTSGLTPSEKEEQQLLRSEYIKAFRNNLKSTLDTIVVIDEQGKQRPLKEKQNTAPKR